MSDQFEGKVALVTGAGSSIALATALAFARQAAKILAADLVLRSRAFCKAVEAVKDPPTLQLLEANVLVIRDLERVTVRRECPHRGRCGGEYAPSLQSAAERQYRAS